MNVSLLLIILIIILLLYLYYQLIDINKKIKTNIITNKDEKKFWIINNNNNEYDLDEDSINENLLILNNKLRTIENKIISKSKNKFFNKILLNDYKNACEIISISYDKIWKLENFILRIPHLNELNDRYTFFYRYMNEHKLLQSNNIPIIQISKHHHAVEWIYKYIKNDIGTILHIDSHADLNPMINKKDFLKKYIKSDKITNKQYKKFYKYIDDIGCVLVPMLLPYEKNNGIIWLTPDWVTEPFNNSEVYLAKNDEKAYYYGGTCPKYTAKEDEGEFIEGDGIVDFSTSNIKYIKNILHKISNNYVLNIDLDYFVTFGSPCYGTNGDDAISDNRTMIDLGFTLKNYQEFEHKIIELDHEMNLIRERIDNFLKLIKLLKKRKKQPKIIIVCDSTMVNYSMYNEKFIKNESELIHEYTPKYLCLWIHNLIVKNLKKIFDE
tara:strand:- start:3297 stop:4613 length:1317 start_codon:yes stop_codon:yes gene_type:complete